MMTLDEDKVEGDFHPFDSHVGRVKGVGRGNRS